MDKKIKVIVIDDEQDLCLLIKTILEDTDKYTVLTANDGIEGEKLFSDFRPELVFLDFVMPRLKGDKVVDYIKEHSNGRRTKVVVMSGLGEMVYSRKSDKWRWLPNRGVVQKRGELPKPMKWKWMPEHIAEQLNVDAYLSKPFTKETLLEVAQSVMNNEEEDSNDSEQVI